MDNTIAGGRQVLGKERGTGVDLELEAHMAPRYEAFERVSDSSELCSDTLLDLHIPITYCAVC